MEGFSFAAPRLARDYYANDGWALQQTRPNGGDNPRTLSEASDPVKGQANTNNLADNKDLQPFNNKKASDPIKEGQAKINDIAVNEDLQATSLQGTISAVNIDLRLSQAHCGNLKNQLQAMSLLQERKTLSKEANHPIVGHALVASEMKASTSFPSAATFPTTFPLAARTIASSSAFTASMLANPATSPSHQHRLHSAIRASSLHVFSPLASNASAIPVLKPNHSATSTHSSTSTIPVILSSSSTAMLAISTIPALPTASPSSQWRDEVTTTSSATIYSILPGGFSRLRAMASPWTPIKPTLPSLLVGDIPILPMSSSSKRSHSLQLPVSAKQTLAPSHPVETLGVGQSFSCPFCGHTPLHPSGGSPTSAAFGFFPLRGRNGVEQDQESKAIMHHHGVDPTRQSTRPRFKMKSELKGFRVHKATLDPG